MKYSQRGVTLANVYLHAVCFLREDNMEPIRSLNSNRTVLATFFNMSSRYVDVFWVDFHGNIVRYFYRVPPQTQKRIHTYVTHPWIARDSDTGTKLHLSGEPVFVTKLPLREHGDEDDEEMDEEENISVRIHIPVYRLEEICIDFFRRQLSESHMSDLEVNQYIKDKLCDTPPAPFRVYQPPRGF